MEYIFDSFMLAQNIYARAAAPKRKTVVSFDMALYIPAKKLLMAQNVQIHIILHPSELYIGYAYA